MKLRISIFSLIAAFIILTGCSDQHKQQISSKNGFAVLPMVMPNESVATFAGGCFWAMQESMLQLKGVNTVISGYAGGTTTNPSYEEVLTQNTGHAEAVQVYYDPSKITYEQLLTAFFYAHDPTELNRQGPDVGSDYRSIAFFRSPAESNAILKIMRQLENKHIYQGSFVTAIEPFEAFYPAEIMHQDYYGKNQWDPYIRSVSKPKVLHVRDNLPALIKASYLR